MMTPMNANQGKPTGSGGCQISMLGLRRACPNKAIVRRWTGKKWVALCRRHDLTAIGPLEVTERELVAGTTRGAVEVTVTEVKRP